MLSPASRAAAYLLAEALLLLLRALASGSPDLPAETVAALQRSLQHLVARLQHIARSGQDLADQAQSVAPASRSPQSRIPERPRPTRTTDAPRPRLTRDPIRRRIIAGNTRTTHANFITIS